MTRGLHRPQLRAPAGSRALPAGPRAPFRCPTWVQVARGVLTRGADLAQARRNELQTTVRGDSANMEQVEAMTQSQGDGSVRSDTSRGGRRIVSKVSACFHRRFLLPRCCAVLQCDFRFASLWLCRLYANSSLYPRPGKHCLRVDVRAGSDVAGVPRSSVWSWFSRCARAGLGRPMCCCLCFFLKGISTRRRRPWCAAAADTVVLV